MLAECNVAAKKVYYTGEYAPDHWAVQPYRLNDPKVVALVYWADSEYVIYINPHDKRGYRSIVRLIKNDDMASTFNRDYTFIERMGLGLIVQMMGEVYSRIVPIAQTAAAGNNAHSFDEQTQITLLGNPSEPNCLSTHIFGRGNPKEEYIKGVKLSGPIPGEIFDMRGETPEVPGNDAKVKWNAGESEKVVARLKVEIEEVKEKYEAYGLRITTR